jgi:hypothetical protein
MKPSEWIKAQPAFLGAQGKTVFDPDFDIDDSGLPPLFSTFALTRGGNARCSGAGLEDWHSDPQVEVSGPSSPSGQQ